MAASIPTEVRTSRNPKSPIHTDSTYPPSVERANPAPAAAAKRLPVASTTKPRTNAAMIWSKNSQPMVGTVRYPVRYKSR